MKKIIIARSVLHSIGEDATIFGRGNITTHKARTSEEVLNLHGVHRADIIITDISMPLMGGVKLCSAIRGDADLRNVSIIMVCDDTEASLAECREAQANAVLPRPVDPVRLFSKISELLMVPRRQDMRSFLHATVHGRDGDRSFLGVSSNISISGLLLETEQALKQGDRVTCTIAIGGREIVAECAVMRVDKLTD